jgi:hypothetical protein
MVLDELAHTELLISEYGLRIEKLGYLFETVGVRLSYREYDALTLRVASAEGYRDTAARQSPHTLGYKIAELLIKVIYRVFDRDISDL